MGNGVQMVWGMGNGYRGYGGTGCGPHGAIGYRGYEAQGVGHMGQ